MVPQVEEVRPAEDIQVGAFSPAAGGTYRLQTSIGTTDTTITLSSFTEPISGTPITMSSLATDIAYATIDPQSTTRKEFVSFTGISQNSDGTATLTGVSRGLSFLSPFTASSTLRKAHPGQSILILSDSPQFFNEYARRRSDETITGQWTFNTFPITPSTTLASTTAAGWVELATPQEAASSTASGTIARLVIPASMATSSPTSTSGHVVPVTGTDGKLSVNFFPTIQGTASTTYYRTTATSTYFKSANVKSVYIQVYGGGGGGGSGEGSAIEGSGGGSGGFCNLWLHPDLLATSTSLFVGSGGNGGVSGIGSAGATSTFGVFCSAGGGGGGTNDSTNGGTGGTASTSSAFGQGFTGAPGQSGGTAYGGNGASGPLGGGGAGSASAGVGVSGSANSGAGGAGARNANGGAGGSGLVVVTEFF